MSLLTWSSFAETWTTEDKVAFNGVDKTITVLDGVTSLAIRSDVYTPWVDWVSREENARFLPAMRYSGGDPIPGGETGVTFFLTNGWRLVYDPAVVSVSGVLYSDTYDTAFWTASGSPVYPATVSALVNSAVVTQNVVTGDLSSVPTVAQIVAQVLAALQATTIPVDAKKMNGADIVGDGSEADPWRGVGVSP